MLSRACLYRSKVERSRICMVHAQIQFGGKLTKDVAIPLLRSFAKRLDVYRRSVATVILGHVQKNLSVTRCCSSRGTHWSSPVPPMFRR